MIMIYGETLNEVKEQLAIIEDSIENGATMGFGCSDDELIDIVDTLLG